jgi:hypothetical protein
MVKPLDLDAQLNRYIITKNQVVWVICQKTHG